MLQDKNHKYVWTNITQKYKACNPRESRLLKSQYLYVLDSRTKFVASTKYCSRKNN